jgi:hypothetical protein
MVWHTVEVHLQRRHALARDPHKSLGDAEVLSDEAFESHVEDALSAVALTFVDKVL